MMSRKKKKKSKQENQGQRTTMKKMIIKKFVKKKHGREGVLNAVTIPSLFHYDETHFSWQP